MISELVAEVFERIGHTWKIGQDYYRPTEEDVEEVLDKAAARLYTEDVDDQLETGGLIIRKADTGHDVFVYVGRYY